MYLLQLLLPLADRRGARHGESVFRTTAAELTEKFGGLTAHTQAPAEGLWKPSRDRTVRDEVVIYEVMAEKLDCRWWRAYRRLLEGRFRQAELVVRAFNVTLL